MTEPKITQRTTEKLMSGGASMNLPPFAAAAPVQPFTSAVHMTGATGRDPWKAEKVAIIGTAPSSRLLAPYGDPSWAIWGSSPGNMYGLPRLPDCWVEMHANFMWPEYRQYGEPYVRWMADQKFPLRAPLLEPYKQLFPRAEEFPWKSLVDEFGPYFFTSTFAWMMAYAIRMGAKVIGLWGVDMSSRDEYITQRPGGHHFIIEARRRGITVVVPDESDLIQPPPLYGIIDSMPFGRKLAAREIEVKGRLNELQNQIAMLQQQHQYLRGALENIDYDRNIWGSLALNGGAQL